MVLVRFVLANHEIMSLCLIPFSILFRLLLKVSLLLYGHLLPEGAHSFHDLMRVPLRVFLFEFFALLLAEENVGGEWSPWSLVNDVNLA